MQNDFAADLIASISGPTFPLSSRFAMVFYQLQLTFMNTPPDETFSGIGIKTERAKEKRKKKVINVLLLGQAESGDSEHPLLWTGLTLKFSRSGKFTTLKSTEDSLFSCVSSNLLT